MWRHCLLLLLTKILLTFAQNEENSYLDPAKLQTKTTPITQELSAIQIIHKYSKQVTVRILPKLFSDSKDVFKLHTMEGQLHIAASSGVAAVWGFNYYLKKYCRSHIGWQVKRISIPDPLPEVDETVVASDRFRYYQNVVTFSYSFVWWDLLKWNEHVDWMALNGINLVLAPIDQEAVWIKVYQKLGMTDEEIERHFTGPAFLSWLRMGNIHGLGGPLLKSWHNTQSILQQHVTERMFNLGMIPILPAFNGHIPKAMIRIYTNTTFIQAKRCKFETKYCCGVFLDPFDPLFQTIGEMFLAELTSKIQTSHIFSADPFIELEESKVSDNLIRQTAKAIYLSITNVDNKGVWLAQNKMFYDKPAVWTEKNAKAFLKSVPRGRLLILDLFSDQLPQYDIYPMYYGAPFIWCMLHNFGGRLEMIGNIPKINENVHEVRSRTLSTMIGIGLTMEGINQNYVVYDLMLEAGWRKEPIGNLNEWVEEYAARRYGCNDTAIAWRALLKSVYSCDNYTKYSYGTAVVAKKPSFNHSPLAWYNVTDLFKALQILSTAPKSCNSPGLHHDLVDVTRQALQYRTEEIYTHYLKRYSSMSVSEFNSSIKLYQDAIGDMEEILASNKDFSAMEWLSDAIRFAANRSEISHYKYNALNQITQWGSGDENLSDYAGKQWVELFHYYYIPRWGMFLSTALEAKRDNVAFNKEQEQDIIRKNLEIPFASAKIEIELPNVDTRKAAQYCYEKWVNMPDMIILDKSNETNNQTPSNKRTLEENHIRPSKNNMDTNHISIYKNNNETKQNLLDESNLETDEIWSDKSYIETEEIPSHQSGMKKYGTGRKNKEIDVLDKSNVPKNQTSSNKSNLEESHITPDENNADTNLIALYKRNNETKQTLLDESNMELDEMWLDKNYTETEEIPSHQNDMEKYGSGRKNKEIEQNILEKDQADTNQLTSHNSHRSNKKKYNYFSHKNNSKTHKKFSVKNISKSREQESNRKAKQIKLSNNNTDIDEILMENSNIETEQVSSDEIQSTTTTAHQITSRQSDVNSKDILIGDRSQSYKSNVKSKQVQPSNKRKYKTPSPEGKTETHDILLDNGYHEQKIVQITANTSNMISKQILPSKTNEKTSHVMSRKVIADTDKFLSDNSDEDKEEISLEVNPLKTEQIPSHKSNKNTEQILSNNSNVEFNQIPSRKRNKKTHNILSAERQAEVNQIHHNPLHKGYKEINNISSDKRLSQTSHIRPRKLRTTTKQSILHDSTLDQSQSHIVFTDKYKNIPDSHNEETEWIPSDDSQSETGLIPSVKSDTKTKQIRADKNNNESGQVLLDKDNKATDDIFPIKRNKETDHSVSHNNSDILSSNNKETDKTTKMLSEAVQIPSRRSNIKYNQTVLNKNRNRKNRIILHKSKMQMSEILSGKSYMEKDKNSSNKSNTKTKQIRAGKSTNKSDQILIDKDYKASDEIFPIERNKETNHSLSHNNSDTKTDDILSSNNRDTDKTAKILSEAVQIPSRRCNKKNNETVLNKNRNRKNRIISHKSKMQMGEILSGKSYIEKEQISSNKSNTKEDKILTDESNTETERVPSHKSSTERNQVSTLKINTKIKHIRTDVSDMKSNYFQLHKTNAETGETLPDNNDAEIDLIRRNKKRRIHYSYQPKTSVTSILTTTYMSN